MRKGVFIFTDVSGVLWKAAVKGLSTYETVAKG